MNTPHLDDVLAQRYVDGAVTEDEAACCCEHLERCDDCCLVVESYRALGDALSGLEAPEPGADFTHAVLARVEDVERAAARSRRATVAIVCCAGALLAGVLAYAGASIFAPTVSSLGALAGDLLHAAATGLDVASPLLRALRIQIVVACFALGLPLLLALRRLAVRPAEAPASVS